MSYYALTPVERRRFTRLWTGYRCIVCHVQHQCDHFCAIISCHLLLCLLINIHVYLGFMLLCVLCYDGKSYAICHTFMKSTLPFFCTCLQIDSSRDHFSLLFHCLPFSAFARFARSLSFSVRSRVSVFTSSCFTH